MMQKNEFTVEWIYLNKDYNFNINDSLDKVC